MIVSKNVALAVINEALKTGVDFAELYVQNRTQHGINISHKNVENCSTSYVYGAGIRLISNGKVVYGYTSDLSKDSLVKLASSLSSSFEGERKQTLTSFKTIKNPNAHKVKIQHNEMSDDDKIEKLRVCEKAIYDYSPLVINARVGLSEIDEYVEIYNSKGNFIHDTRIRTRAFLISEAGKDGEFQNGFEGPGGGIGDEIFEKFDLVALSKKAAKCSVDLLSAPECPSGKMTVIIGNKFGGVLFHEACGHPLEGHAVSHNSSAFCGKIGEKIASDVVSAVDDGTIPNGWGSMNFDDEGEKTTKNQLIKNGVLVNYMVDNYTGSLMGMKSTGACRRQSYRRVPTTRMTNTYIENGTSTKEEIIANTDFGLYCVSFSGGSVDPTTAKFNFTASEAYIIKNGKIDHLVKGASLIGYGHEILMNIDMVGNDCARGQGMCGASSGSCEVDVGQPTLRIQNVTVGGRGEKI